MVREDRRMNMNASPYGSRGNFNRNEIAPVTCYVGQILDEPPSPPGKFRLKVLEVGRDGRPSRTELIEPMNEQG